MIRAYERGFRGYIVLKGPGRVQVPTLSFLGLREDLFWSSLGLNFREDFFFFRSSPNFGQKIGFFGLHQILGKNSDLISVKTFFFCFWSSHNFWQKIIIKNFAQLWCPKRFGGPASTFVPPGKISL